MVMDNEKKVEELFNPIFDELALAQKLPNQRKMAAMIKTVEKSNDIPLGMESPLKQAVVVTLLYMYICSGHPREACQIVAEYHFELSEIEKTFSVGIPAVLNEKIRQMGTGLNEALFGLMLSSPVSYEEFYDIYEAYPSPEYAQLLIRYARKKDRRTDTVLLSNQIKKYVLDKKDGLVRNILDGGAELYYEGVKCNHTESMLLRYYTNRLEDLSYLKDYVEIRNCIREAKEEYDYHRGAVTRFSPELLPHFWTAMCRALNIIGRYDRTAEIVSEMSVSVKNAEYYSYAAEAYLASDRLELAEQYCERSVALNSSTLNRQLLAQIMFTKKDYRGAEKVLTELIGTMNRKVEDRYVTEENGVWTEEKMVRELTENDFRKSLESPYSLLFMCYVFEGETAKAGAVYEQMKEKLGSSDMVMISGHLLQVETYAGTHLEEVEKEKEALKALLNDSVKKYDRMKTVIGDWTAKLADMQLLSDKPELTSDDWEKQFSGKMDAMLEEVSSRFRRDDAGGYERNLKKIKKRFPGLAGDALSFLTSAEQMYEVFSGNAVLDFAPIMVEYCKVFELLISDYFDRTGEYDEERSRNERKDSCLGTLCFVINMAPKKKLGDYIPDIKMLTAYRNDSAHKQLTKEEPRIVNVRNIIWNKNLINILCE